MKTEGLLSEHVGLKIGINAVDVAPGVTSNRIGLSLGYKVAFVVQLTSAAHDADVTLRQADALSGGTSKALEIENPYFVKAAAATKFTKKDASGNQIVDADLNGDQGLLVIEVLAEDLDRDNGFDHVEVELNSAGARVASVVEVLYDVRKSPAYELDL